MSFLKKKNNIFFIIFIIFIAVVIYCLVLNVNNRNEKKNQYAIINDYVKDKAIKIYPDSNNYLKVVDKFSMASVNSEYITIPKAAIKIKKIIFYQSSTKKLFELNKKNEVKPFIEINIYRDNQNQYAEVKMISVQIVKTSYIMPEDLTELIDKLE